MNFKNLKETITSMKEDQKTYTEILKQYGQIVGW